MQKLLGPMRRAIVDYKMISPGDHIAVGLSGGKDSVSLLFGLARLKEFMDIPFEITAISVDPQFNNTPTDFSPVTKLCQSLGIPHIIRPTRLYEIVFEERKEKNPCSLCARMRRGILHNTAIDAGCNKIALGHHLDDAVETFFLNLLYGGRIACFSPVTHLSRKNLYQIRPLIYLREKTISSAVKNLDLPVIKSPCPMDRNTSRQKVKELLSSLEKDYPALRDKAFRAMQLADIGNFGIED